MAAGTAGSASVPRNFKLLDELEDAERSQEGAADISLGACLREFRPHPATSETPTRHFLCSPGLVSMEDRLMNDWHGSIVQAAVGLTASRR